MYLRRVLYNTLYAIVQVDIMSSLSSLVLIKLVPISTIRLIINAILDDDLFKIDFLSMRSLSILKINFLFN